MRDNTAWNRTAKSMHWIIAVLIFVTASLGWIAHESAVSPGKLQLYLWHKSFGISVLGLMILRLVWRLTQGAPEEVNGLSEKDRKLANFGHWIVYAFAILLPLSGWILNSAANYPFRWFGLFEVPMLMDASDDVQAAATRAHLILFWVLAALVAGHILMAFKHHLAGIPLLSRMLPNRWKITPVLLVLVGSSLTLVGLSYNRSYSTTNPPANKTAAAVAVSADAPEVTVSDTAAPSAQAITAPLWAVNAETSTLTFIGTYDTIEFEGGFSEFEPLIHFDPEDLEGSSFDVAIQLTSVATGSTDRDELLPNDDWFWFEKYQQAKYVASSFERLEDNRYRANGVLDLKGTSKAVPLDFAWESVQGDAATLVGEAIMNRRDFDIGGGYWADDPTVGYEIKVLVNLELSTPG